MDRRGVRLDGRPLAATGRRRDRQGPRAAKRRPAEVPFAASAEQMAAYEVLDCADLDEAVGSASTHPMAAAGTIEVRPVWEELTDPVADGDRRAGHGVSPSADGGAARRYPSARPMNFASAGATLLQYSWSWPPGL